MVVRQIQCCTIYKEAYNIMHKLCLYTQASVYGCNGHESVEYGFMIFVALLFVLWLYFCELPFFMYEIITRCPPLMVSL